MLCRLGSKIKCPLKCLSSHVMTWYKVKECQIPLDEGYINRRNSLRSFKSHLHPRSFLLPMPSRSFTGNIVEIHCLYTVGIFKWIPPCPQVLMKSLNFNGRDVIYWSGSFSSLGGFFASLYVWKHRRWNLFSLNIYLFKNETLRLAMY